MKLIIGLGNPEQTYAHTRHNIGWDAVTRVHDRLLELDPSVEPFLLKKEFVSMISEVRFHGEKILLVHPTTYMNLSGQAVQKLMQFFKVAPADVLIIQDEMDFEPGRIGFTAQGGPAGHNGISSIQETIGRNDLTRLRIGIGRPTGQIKKEDFVLQPFSQEEQPIIKEALARSTTAIIDWIERGTVKAMNTWNS